MLKVAFPLVAIKPLPKNLVLVVSESPFISVLQFRNDQLTVVKNIVQVFENQAVVLRTTLFFVSPTAKRWLIVDPSTRTIASCRLMLYLL